MVTVAIFFGPRGTDIIAKHSVNGFPAACHEDRYYAALPVAKVLLFVGVVLPPLGSARPHHASRLAASALLLRRFSVVRRQLKQHPPTVDPSVPSAHRNISQILPSPPYRESIFEYLIAKKQAEREILVLVYGWYDFENTPYMASRQQLIARIAAAGTSCSPATVPSMARVHVVTSAHNAWM
jgi:hypothetical protein